MFHFVERVIRGLHQCFDGRAVFGINRHPNTYRKMRFLMIVGQPFADPVSDLAGIFCPRLRQNDGELIASIAHGRIN